jgi:hypothetical protein
MSGRAEIKDADVCRRRPAIGERYNGRVARSRMLALLALTVLLGSPPAAAQSDPSLDPPPPATPEAEPEPPPPPPSDPPELIALFEHAIDALLDGDRETASAELAEVAARSVEPRRRAAANEVLQALSRRRASPAADPPPAAIAAGDDAMTDLESGRAQLLGVSIVLGLNYGWMVPLALDIDDEKGFAGLYLLTASASFAVPYLLTRGDHVTRGMSILGGGGAALGLGHGALIYGLVAGEDGFDSDSGLRAMLGVMIGSSIAGGVLGYRWAKDTRMDAGRASAITAGSIWGAGFAAGANVLVAGDEPNARAIFGSMLAASLAGGFGGKLYSGRRRPTEGDAGLVSTSGIVGAYAALSPLLISETENPRAIVGALMVGAGAGLVAGDLLLEGKDYSRSEAGIVGLGTLAGGLLGAGGAFLATPEDADAAKWIVTGSAAGAIGGLLIMLRVVEPSGQPPAASTIAPAPIVGLDGATGLGIAGTF